MTVDMVNHPPHYNSHGSGVEVIEITRHLPFNIGNAVKYIMRSNLKGATRQDLEKAMWYLRDHEKMVDTRYKVPVLAYMAYQRYERYEQDYPTLDSRLLSALTALIAISSVETAILYLGAYLQGLD